VSERAVLVRMEAEVSKFVQGMAKAEKATQLAKKAQQDLGKAADEVAQKQEKSSDKAARELADLAKQHQAAAKAAGLQYDAQGRLVDGNSRVLSSAQATAHGLDTFSEAVYKSGFKAEQAAEAQRRASEEAEAAAKKAAAEAEKTANRRADAARESGQSFLTFGAASVAALGASTKAAMDWESAWAGVTKTVDGTPEQMADLESELRGLAKTLPLSHTEIAAVAEAAGQLGVKRKDVASFTKTMIDLGETTNLTADEAATNIAQIANVMGTAGSDVDNFGATLVALGNDGASTEKEILDMAQRIAGAGKLVGASESDVLALSNTLASVGIEAQLGGGVVSRVLQRMYADVKTGGKGLQELAKVSGVSSKEFAAAFESDPVRAMDMMVKGLSRVKDSGGNVVQTMEDLGIKGTEETSVILRMAGAGDLLSKSLELGSKSWKENTALAAEAEKRYATTESKIKVAWNNIKDAAIDAGAELLPVIQTLAEGAAGLAQGFGSLPQPVQSLLTVAAAGAGAVALAAGGFLTLLPKIRDAKDAYAALAPAGSRANTVLSRTGRIAAGAATGLAAIGAVSAVVAPALDEILKPTGETGDALQKFGGQAAQGAFGADTLNKSFQDLVQHQEGVSDFQQAINGIADPGIWGNIDNVLVGGIRILSFGLADVSSTSEEARDRFKAMGQQLATLDPASANKAFRSMAENTDGSQQSLERLLEFMPEYRRSLEEQAKATHKGTDNQSLLKIAMDEGGSSAEEAAGKQALLDKAIEDTGVSVEGLVEDMDKFLEQLFQAGVLTMSSRDAAAAYQDRLDSVADAKKQIIDAAGKMGATLLANKSDFDLTTEAGRLANETFQGLARDGMAEVEAKAAEGAGQDVLQEKLNHTYDDLINVAGQFGITGDAAVNLAREVLGVPDGVDIKTWMDNAARVEAEKTKAAVEGIPSQKSVDVFFNKHHTEFFEDPQGARLGNGQQFAGFAGGGDLDSAPGPAGVDSKLFWGAKGEHVLTASEVDLMGGQQAVYKFRSDLRSGRVTSHAAGGEVGVRYQMPAAALARYAPAPAAAPSRSFTQEVTFHGAPAYTREQFEAFADQRLNQENRRFE